MFGLVATSIEVGPVSYTMLTGQEANPQEIYIQGASGGLEMIILSVLLMGILTPIGEEFLFRGVLTNAMLKYVPYIGVGGSAVIFALLHGISIIFPAALVGGLVAGEVFRRSGSIWPDVIVHVMFNLPTIPALLLVGASQ